MYCSICVNGLSMKDGAVQACIDHTNRLLIHIVAGDKPEESSGQQRQPGVKWGSET